MTRLIDADALKEKKVYSHERHEYVVPVCEIDWLPTVEERPHGEWKKDGFFAICSECGHELQHYELVVSRLNFCPNCGADMRKEGDAE